MADLHALLTEVRSIWGDRRMTLPEIAVATTVVVGDIARQARAHQEGFFFGRTEHDELAKELGNLILSGLRWADDLGLDIDECIDRALDAQRRYVEERRRG